ncbi:MULTISPECIES: helix-turn-helix transcriptional regulator [Pseudonocardia]|uniref:helix-turn-helix transcriptional regulator n=1 Tax=Pseudonocardia TaxID=1847 RepID=UPI0018D5A15A|nr:MULTISPECIES: helix-turn-helix transcriptional regulator [Pseudonocardia]
MTEQQTSPARVRTLEHTVEYSPPVTDWTGPEIRRRRKNHGLTQQQVADTLGVSLGSISKWEGVDRPRISDTNSAKLAELLPDDGTGEALEPVVKPQPAGPFRTAVEWSPAEIIRRRQRHDLTQRQLAEALGVSLRTVTGWEAEGRPPSGRHLAALQRVLRLPSDAVDYAGPYLDEASRDELLDALGEGPLLHEADTGQVLLRLVELHNQDRRRRGLPPLLDTSGVTPPLDLPEHRTSAGPDLDTAEQVNRTETSSHGGDTP